MADEDNATLETPEQTPVTPPSDETLKTDSKEQARIPYDRFKQVNDQKNDLQKRLDALEEAEQERIKAKALADGDFQKVIDDLTPQAEKAKELELRLQAYQDRDKAELDAELEALDEDMRGLVIAAGDSSMQLAWVRQAKRAGLFNKPKPPVTDSGETGDPKEKQVEESEATRNIRQYATDQGFNAKIQP